MDVSRCRSCDAEIIWARTEGGNLMPIDAQPCENGNIVIADGVAKVVRDVLLNPPTEIERYKSHYATCPNAGQHRKKGKK